MDSILDNPLAYAYKTQLEKERKQKFSQLLITASYILAVQKYPFAESKIGGPVAKEKAKYVCQQKRAEYFNAILIGYDLGCSRRSVTGIIEQHELNNLRVNPDELRSQLDKVKDWLQTEMPGEDVSNVRVTFRMPEQPAPAVRFMELVTQWNALEFRALDQRLVNEMECIAREAATLIRGYKEEIEAKVYSIKAYDFEPNQDCKAISFTQYFNQ